MKTMKQEYTAYNRTYKLVKSQFPYALYKDKLMNQWELLKLRTYKADFTFPSGSKVEKGEIKYPATNDWGDYGWTLTSEERALEKFEECLQGKPARCPSLGAPNATSSSDSSGGTQCHNYH